ncbi:MAG: hypothetical protein R6W76_19105 [Caldilinea sp.]
MASSKGPTLVDVAREVAATIDGPILYDEFVQRVLAIHPSNAKHPVNQAKSTLRYELDEFGLVFADLSRKLLVPVRTVLTGLTVRHTFVAEEISGRRLLMGIDEQMLLPGRLHESQFQLSNLRLQDADGSPVKATFEEITRQATGLFGLFNIALSGFHIPRWLAQHSVKEGDSALLTIVVYDPPVWQIVHEPAAKRDQSAIAEANQALVGLLYDQLESASREDIYLKQALLSAFAQLSPHQRHYPGDPWSVAIEQDGRMRHNGFDLRYQEHVSAIERMLDSLLEDDQPAAPLQPLSPEQERLVFQIKVNPVRNKRLWRRIEILGGQTLSELNRFLVSEFKHDWDHLGGFWKLVPRGAGKRHREIELATIDPFEEGKGADSCMAELDLEPGSQLRWVFDFGDYHEYLLLVELVEGGTSALNEDDYPRVIAQNKPKYVYCVACQEQGRQTIATQICIDCSNRVDRVVAYCNMCQAEHDEEHYTEEIVY